MQSKKLDLLTYLVELYKYLYSYKDLLKIKFKYSVNEIEDLYKQINTESDAQDNCKNDNEKICKEILLLKNPDDIKNYLFGSNEGREELLRKLNYKEFAYLYNVIFSSPLKSNMRKIDALNQIKKYFSGISRAISMKP